MKFRRALTLLALAAAPAAAQWQEAQGVSLEEAQHLPEAQLAQRLLGAAGGWYREIERPAASADDPSWTIGFASAPWASAPGLCAADTARVEIQPQSPYGSSTRNVIVGVDLGARFAFVGERSEVHGAWADEARERQEAACAGAGPIFAGSSAYFPIRFRAYDLDQAPAAGAAMSLAVFLRRVTEVARASSLEIGCGGDEEQSLPETICADARALLSDNGLASIVAAEVEQCRERPEALCATLMFPAPRGGASVRGILMSVTTGATSLIAMPAEIRVETIEIAPGSLVAE